jgi:hypothetical protein
MQRVLAATLLLASSVLSAPGAIAAGTLSCDEAFSIPTDLLKARVSIFGELHGTEQIPKAVSSFVCAQLRSGWRVTLVLEISATEQEAITRYLHGSGNAADRAALLAGPFWTRPIMKGASTQDGRASIAVLQLIEEMRQHAKEGRRIGVIAAAAYGRGQDMDEMLAKAIRQAVSEYPEGKVVALMGDNHASVSRGRPWDADFEGVGHRLRDLKPAVIHTIHSGGSAWICKQEGCGKSGLWADPRNADRPIGYSPAEREGFNWALMLGTVTASDPAVPE